MIDPSNTSLESINAIKQLIEHRRNHFDSCFVQMFAMRDRGEFVPYFGRFLFLEQAIETEDNWEYDEGFAVDEILTVDAAISRLEELVSTGGTTFADHYVSFEGDLRNDWWFERSSVPGFNPSDGTAFGLEWPANLWQLQFESTRGHARGKMMMHPDLPLFLDFESLVAFRTRYGRPIERYERRLFVQIPDYSARICDVRRSALNLSFRIESNQSDPSELMVGTVSETENVEQHNYALVNADQRFVVQVSEATRRWGIVILRKDNGSLVDFRQSQNLENPTAADLKNLDGDGLKSVLGFGEGVQSEFKPFPKSKDNVIKQEIAKSAIAFSNTSGGTIFVGVDDEGEVIGAPPSTSAVDTLLSSIRDYSDPKIYGDVTSIKADGLTVHAIYIKPSRSKPHIFIRGGGSYVRVGSTDRPATSHEIQEMSSSRRNSPFGYESNF